MQMFELSDVEIEQGDLAALAHKAGYPSLRAICNDLSLWNWGVDAVKSFLNESIELHQESIQ